MNSRSSNLLRNLISSKEIGVFIPLVLLTVFFAIMNPDFIGINNISAMCRGLAFLGIVAIGQTLVILVGEIDVSVGSVAGLGAVMGTWFAAQFHWDTVTSILFALLLCGAIGVFNGIAIVIFKIPSFIATIGMLYIAKGIVMIITKGYPVYPLPAVLNKIGSATPFGTSVAFVAFLVLVVVFEFILRKTTYGRNIYATGDNIHVSRLAGINVTLIKISTFVITSVLAGVAGILVSCQLQTGSPTTGSGWELQVIAATAIGGISLLGGSGSMIGTLIGTFILAVLTSGLIFLGMNTHWQTVAIGSVMILAVFMDLIRRKRKLKS